MSNRKQFGQLFRRVLPMVALGAACASLGFADIAHQLGAAAGYAVLGLSGSTDQLSSGGLVINGNIGVGSGATAAISSGVVNGSFFENSTGEVTQSGGETVPVIVQSLTAAQQAAINLANFAANAANNPTQTFTSITSPMTITGNGGENVIDVTGSQGIHLSGGALTISGGPHDFFIIDVSGSSGMQLSGNTNIVLQGVAANQVLWYFPGSANNIVQTSGDSNSEGIFLAPNGGIQINGGTHDSEFIAGGSISFQSNPKVTPPPVIPEPGSLSMWLASVACFGAVLLRRRARAKGAS